MVKFTLVIGKDQSELSVVGPSDELFENMVKTFVTAMDQTEAGEKLVKLIEDAAHVAQMIVDDDGPCPWKGGNDEDERNKSRQA